jgi:hypothetical protein
MKSSLAELHDMLGQPHGRGTRVMFGADNHRSRCAFMTWACYEAAREAGSAEVVGCGSACIAYNFVPYESGDIFPDDNWTLDPCAMHAKTL